MRDYELVLASYLTSQRSRRVSRVDSTERPSKLVLDTCELIAKLGLPEPVTEYRFWPGRKFAIDFAWPDLKIAVECEGRGHALHYNFASDMEKYNELACLGWTLIRIEPRHFKGGHAEWWLRRAFGLSGGEDPGSLRVYATRKRKPKKG